MTSGISFNLAIPLSGFDPKDTLGQVLNIYVLLTIYTIVWKLPKCPLI